jgi:hypothetical protein
MQDRRHLSSLRGEFTNRQFTRWMRFAKRVRLPAVGGLGEATRVTPSAKRHFASRHSTGKWSE